MSKIQRNHSAEIVSFAFLAFIMMLIFHYLKIDDKLASLFFDKNLKWVYRDHFIFENLLHKGGVWLTILIFLGIIFKVLQYRRVKISFHYYLLVLLSSSTVVVIVAFLKKFTTFPCPWHTDIFGGEQKILGFSELFSSQLPNGHCFPAGHSSGGFCFLSFYIITYLLTGKRDFFKLTLGLTLGLTFGSTQQIRGAHFLSHDMATLAISIFIPWLTTLLYSRYN